jgi:ribosome-associated heat shock protein Hsp15
MIPAGKPRNVPTRRVDQWLWFARFFKSRTRAAQACLAGRIRVNAAPIAKASHEVKEGDVLTFFAGGRVRVVRVQALGSRRAPAAEARALYQDLNRSPDDAAGSRSE